MHAAPRFRPFPDGLADGRFRRRLRGGRRNPSPANVKIMSRSRTGLTTGVESAALLERCFFLVSMKTITNSLTVQEAVL